MRSAVYVAIAPKWKAAGRPVPLLGTRPLLRWEVVRETRPAVVNGITSSMAAHVSFHWTKRGAFAAIGRLHDGGES